jgi:hypothetical protein
VFTLLLAQGGEFAFVVFRAAADVNALPADVASLLVGAVALSMLLTPLALVAVDRWLLPRYANCGRPPAPPELSEPQSAPVIIAGFGRYGQIVSRLLGAEGVAVTVLDHDAEMIEAARVLGSRVFYGDATRLDLLRTAGAAEARILVVAVDDVEQSLAIVDLARQHFPQLELVARARDVTHWHQLRDRGVMRVRASCSSPAWSAAAACWSCWAPAPRRRASAPTAFATTTWRCSSRCTLPQGPRQADLGDDARAPAVRGAAGPGARAGRPRRRGKRTAPAAPSDGAERA